VRFALAHKLTTYLMVMCAFAAIALSGFLSPAWVLAGLVGAVVSWFWEPPRVRIERWATAWTVLSVLVFLFQALQVFAGRDVILSGGELLVYFAVVKLFNRAASRDYQQIYVLSFLMLVAGTVLNSEITYGFFFLGYVVSATWALILFHLRREMEDNFLLKHSAGRPSERVEVARVLSSRRIVGGKFFAGTSVVSLLIFVGSTMLFLAIPRIGFGFFFQKSRSGVHMAGFSEGIELGAHGVIKEDRTVVMRVEVDEPWQGSRSASIHWRGIAFDRYQGGRWSRTPDAERGTRRTSYGVTHLADRDRYYMAYEGRDPDASPRPTIAGSVRQVIYLEPMGTDVLFGASIPVAFEVDRPKPGHRTRRGADHDEMHLGHDAGIKYVAYSSIEPPPAEVLRRAPPNFMPVGYERLYLQLPDALRYGHDQRIPRLARDIAGGARTRYDKAVAIERWLKSNLAYTLSMQSPPEGVDPVEFFLFDRKRGHCEYFSSAMVILLRALDIPARNVNGFLGGEWNEYDDYVAVRAGDAHSWVEVYFAGVGWVTFDPTPPSDELGRGTGFLARMRRFFDTLRFKWFKWVIEYDLYEQLAIFESIGKLFKGGGRGVGGAWTAVTGWLHRHRTGAIAGGGAIAALLVVLGLRRRRRRPAAEPGRERRRRHPVTTVYLQTVEMLGKRGYGRAASATPREHADALVARGAPGAASLRELAELHYRAAYGGRAGDDDLARARTLRAAVAGSLDEARRARRAA